MEINLAELRNDYSQQELDEASVAADPFAQFGKWFADYVASQPLEPNAFILATVGLDGAPSSRVVLLKGFDSDGFVFFTNYTSSKAIDIDHESRVGMTFFWPELERQVRVSGIAEKTSREESESYFASRPTLSKLGAWASKQSAKLSDRSELERKFEEARGSFADDDIPCPPFWGGYRIVPTSFEFWQGRRSRLHDRICYERKESGWSIFRLYP